MNGLKPIKMPSAKEKVAAELRKAILSRQMKEGEILSLDSVASQLNVSAMPVREAFQILARDGLIQLRKNKGAVVLGITETYIREHYQPVSYTHLHRFRRYEQRRTWKPSSPRHTKEAPQGRNPVWQSPCTQDV